MTDDDEPGGAPLHPQERQYCAACGEICIGPARYCSTCGRPLTVAGISSVATLAALLTELNQLRAEGILDERCFAALRDTYERRLVAVRPERPPAPAFAGVTGAPASGSGPVSAHAVQAGGTVAAPPAVPRGPTLSEWAAARQADILLYLGAFILSVAALIFVGYQGDALSGLSRFVILSAYTVGFLGLGLALPRWERVREAGPVFLALGAGLVPVDCLALRTLVLSPHAVPDDVLWLFGSAVTAALYFTLALRGYGRWYALPGAAATLTGWGALGSVMGLPVEWFGAWFVGGLALVMGGTALLRPRFAGLVDGAAVLIGAAALLFAHTAAAIGGTDTAQLPTAYALAVVTAAVSLARRRTVLAMGLLPALSAMTVATAWWSALGFSGEWDGVVVAAAGLGYLALAVLDDAARARAWASAAAGCGGFALAIALATADNLPDIDRAAVPLTFVLVLAGTVTAVVRWRWVEALAILSPLGAATAAAVGWALWNLPQEWLSAFIAAAAIGYLVIAERDDRYRVRWRWAAAAVGVLALLWGHAAALGLDTSPWQLPAAYAFLLLGAAWDAWRHQDAGVLALPALGAVGAGATLWALGVAPVWWAYPGAAAALVIVAAAPWWRQRPLLRGLGRPYALAAAIAPAAAFTPLFATAPVHGMVMFAVAAGVALICACGARGGAAWMPAAQMREPWQAAERRALAWLSGALLLAAAGYGNAWAGVEGADRAWVFVALGAAAWAGLSAFGRRREVFEILVPSAATAFVLATLLAATQAGAATLVTALGATGAALAALGTRRPLPWLVAMPFGAAALGFAWRWQGWRPADLSLVYAGCAAVLWAGLSPLRRYEAGERGTAITVLSWLPWLTALASAFVLLLGRYLVVPARGGPLTATREWADLALVVAAAAMALTLESMRLRSRTIAIAGTAGLMAAVLLAIAIRRPENVQAYTLPLGLYLAVLGLSLRRSPDLFGRHMAVHEAVLVLGLLCMVLPAAEQNLSPGGGRYGLEIIAQGLVFLAVGLLLSARWLVVGGVLTLSGVALRWLATDLRPPYWLTLGVVGTLLLAFGVMVLLERDAWERARARIARWWQTTKTSEEAGRRP